MSCTYKKGIQITKLEGWWKHMTIAIFANPQKIIKMRYALIFIVILSFSGCQTDSNKQHQALAKRVDSLEKQVAKQYTPGLGTFMKHIQMHHAKLWFAGINQNWQLADFEIHELKERFEAVEKFHADNEEIEPMDMIYPPLDSVSLAIDQENKARFEKSFTVLNNTCNNCHKATDHAFVKIQKPEMPPFGNQQYKPSE